MGILEVKPGKKSTPIQEMTLSSDKIKGLEDFKVDEEIEVKLKLKVLQPMGHPQVWNKEELKNKPLEGKYEVLSGKAVSVQSKIDGANTIEELDEAVEGADDNE